MEEKPCVHSIMSMIFTKDGDVIVIKNDKNELDTLPQYFFGKKENKNYTGTGGIEILNQEQEYKEAVGYFFAVRSYSSDTGIKNGFLIGNKETLMDCGELRPNLATQQIKEMKTLSKPSYIRIKRETFEITVENQQMLNQIQTRFVVIPELDPEEYQDVIIFAVEDLEKIRDQNQELLSPRLLWQMSGEELKEVKRFSNNLKDIITIHPAQNKKKEGIR